MEGPPEARLALLVLVLVGSERCVGGGEGLVVAAVRPLRRHGALGEWGERGMVKREREREVRGREGAEERGEPAPLLGDEDAKKAGAGGRKVADGNYEDIRRVDVTLTVTAGERER